MSAAGASALADAAAQADALANAGDERGLADLRSRWGEDVESAARDGDYRVRSVAYRALGQFRFRQRLELLRRGLEDTSPACRGAALISLELLSRGAPGVVNAVRPALHELAANDPNGAVRRLAILTLRNGSPQRDTVLILSGIAEDEEQDRALRDTAHRVAAGLTRKSRSRAP